MTDREIKKQLESMPRSDWNRLFDLMPEIEQTKDFGQPYIRTTPVVHKFGDLVYDLGLVVPFDWSKWPEGVAAIDNESADFETFATWDLVKAIALIMRKDHFSNGTLVCKFNEGIMQKILVALRRKITGGYDGGGANASGQELFTEKHANVNRGVNKRTGK